MRMSYLGKEFHAETLAKAKTLRREGAWQVQRTEKEVTGWRTAKEGAVVRGEAEEVACDPTV